MGSKYNSLLQNVDSISPNDLVFIKEDLNIAKDSWKNIKDYAEKIYAEDIKVVDTKKHNRIRIVRALSVDEWFEAPVQLWAGAFDILIKRIGEKYAETIL